MLFFVIHQVKMVHLIAHKHNRLPHLNKPLDLRYHSRQKHYGTGGVTTCQILKATWRVVHILLLREPGYSNIKIMRTGLDPSGTNWRVKRWFCMHWQVVGKKEGLVTSDQKKKKKLMKPSKTKHFVCTDESFIFINSIIHSFH